MHYNLLTRDKFWCRATNFGVHPLNALNPKTCWFLAPVVLLVGCGWVDSTGRSSNSAPVAQISFADGEQSPVRVLNELDTLLLRASSSDEDGIVNQYEWSQEPVEQGALSQCAGQPDFDINIAAESLAAACSTRANCVVTIDLQAESGENDVQFLLSVPELRAPVGVTYELTVTDNEGGVGTQRSTFCLIAINEAPTAQNDFYAVVEGDTLQVSPDLGVLENDVDDEHVLNQTLVVLTESIELPSQASSFELRSDGSFTYVPLPFDDRRVQSVEDTFEYFISDGVHDPVSATATVNIVAFNDAPELLDDLPEFEAIAGIEFEADLTTYFEDPEGAVLSFAVVGGALPPSGGIVLAPNGILGGTPAAIDEGIYTIDVAVSDGSKGTTAALTFIVAENLPVAAISILPQEVELGDDFELDVSEFFTDPEDQPLSYSFSAVSTDADLSINARTGLLTGTFADVGRYTIDVSADDGVNIPSRIRFSVEVSSENDAPVFRGLIASQTIDLGDRVSPISGQFSDPNDDDLEYSMQGQLPLGLTLNETTGVISGRPTIAGNYTSLRLIATDPFGLFARSNSFNVRVRAVSDE